MKTLRFALIGYGKMGRAIEAAAVARGHCISLKITSSNADQLTAAGLSDCDVAIEFTTPDTAVENIKFCIAAGVPVLSGSTGWTGRHDEVAAYCHENGGTLLHTGNFSIGVNLFFAVNRLLASLMNAQPEYNAAIEEVHHTQKKDAPSGTALLLADDIVSAIDRIKNWSVSNSPGDELLISSLREDPAPGTHTVTYNSSADEIMIRHTAKNRSGFATGAVLAAEFLYGKKGIFKMSDVLGF